MTEQSSIVIGTRNVQVIVNVAVDERTLEKWLSVIQTLTLLGQHEDYETDLAVLPTGKVQIQQNSYGPYQQQLLPEEQSGLVIVGTVEHTQ